MDIKTLIGCILISNLLCTALMMAYSAQHHDKSTQVFISGRWLQLAGYLLVGMTQQLNAYASMMGGNVLLLAGCGAEAIALLMLLDKWNRSKQRFYYTLIAVTILVYVATFIAGAPPYIRIVEISVFVCLICAYPIFLLASRQGHSPLRKLMAAIYFAALSVHIARVLDIFIQAAPITVFTPTFVQIATFICMLVATVGGGCGFVLLAKEKADNELIWVATHDGLTGALNRSSFFDLADRDLSRIQQSGGQAALMIIDLDHFKKINDTFGHAEGDTFLKKFSEIAMRKLRTQDLFARHGGEEFAIFMPHTNAPQAMESAEQLRKTVEIECADKNLTISIGISCFYQESTIDILLMEADLALYEAKRGGRNRVVLFGALDSSPSTANWLGATEKQGLDLSPVQGA